MVAPTEVERVAYSPAELAKALGCTRQHVQNCIRRGDIPSVKLGARRLIPRAAVDALLEGVDDDA